MKKYRLFSRGLTAMVVTGMLGAASTPVFSQSTTIDGKKSSAPNYDRTRRPTPPLSHFDRVAARLQITPAQQSVWTQYRNAIEAQAKIPLPLPPAGETDAVTVLRWRADRAAHQARRLAAIADATDVLQRSLDVEQRKRLNELVREEQRTGMPRREPLAKTTAPVDGKQESNKAVAVPR